MQRKIPRCMSTQHPDNVHIPFFAEDAEMRGEDEIQEAYYAFSHLGCDEQMWDYEGKEVDNFVVKKLLSTYDSFFHKHYLGQDIFITPRVPNPAVEQSEAKILLETLGSIPRSYDAARIFDQNSPPPILEVILPMTTSAKQLNHVYHYYADFLVGKQDQLLPGSDLTIREWLGEFNPRTIQVIPLFESIEDMLNAPNVLREYVRGKQVEDQRVFLARSDPAMNFGLASTVLANKITFSRLDALQNELGIALHPILGVGSAPFRGGLTPFTALQVCAENPSVATFTIQSAFKYDYPPDVVTAAIAAMKAEPVKKAAPIEEERALELMGRLTAEYNRQICTLVPLINRMAAFVPRRRRRKLHIGVFGYSRSVNGMNLPRAIGFTAALYSIGVPPEVLGLNALKSDDVAFLRAHYLAFEKDLRSALRFADLDSPFFPRELRPVLADLLPVPEPDGVHLDASRQICAALKEGNGAAGALESMVLRAAQARCFLG